ncbi:MAG TPA: fluoride efflux transporter CrcB [bacterium]|nr:fluoride efflux transporter CrcB [bacterium]
MDKYIVISVGAILGAFCRYWMGLWVASKWGTEFAYGTLAINLIGSFVLGLFLTMNLDRGLFTPNARFLVATGWCASFTTYSTFSWETFKYLQEGNLKLAGANMALTLIGCLAATWAGATVGKIL